MDTHRAGRPNRRRRLATTLFAALCLLGVLGVFTAVVPEHELQPASSVRIPALSAQDSARRYAVYVADYGYHTAIFVQQPTRWAQTHAEAAPDRGGAYVEYAWGDRRFYMESRYAPWSVFATLLLPTEAVAYVAHHSKAPELQRSWRALRRRDVTAEEMHTLTMQLERWIVRDSAGARSRAFPAVPGYRGRFHRALGRYSWWRNCNRWTLAQLAVIGAARERALVVTPPQVLSRLQGFAPVTTNDAASPPASPPASLPASLLQTALQHVGDSP